jgi:hypothetical protein
MEKSEFNREAEVKHDQRFRWCGWSAPDSPAHCEMLPV